MHRAIGMVKGLGVTMDGDMNDDVERASERLRTLYAAIACGVIVLDMTREVVDANAAAQQIVVSSQKAGDGILRPVSRGVVE